MTIEEKVALCAIKHHSESHIRIDESLCGRCKTRVCTKACPARLYTVNADTGKVQVDHSGCLECGTCLIVCPLRSVTWRYPDAGYGIRYRYG